MCRVRGRRVPEPTSPPPLSPPPSCFQLMSVSQVSGGFWCQLPSSFAHAFAMTKRHMEMHHDSDDEASECGSGVWTVVFLPRPNEAAGLSGGWRTFAIDQVRGVLRERDKGGQGAVGLSGADHRPGVCVCIVAGGGGEGGQGASVKGGDHQGGRQEIPGEAAAPRVSSHRPPPCCSPALRRAVHLSGSTLPQGHRACAGPSG